MVVPGPRRNHHDDKRVPREIAPETLQDLSG
jgi:hypothetical protein